MTREEAKKFYLLLGHMQKVRLSNIRKEVNGIILLDRVLVFECFEFTDGTPFDIKED